MSDVQTFESYESALGEINKGGFSAEPYYWSVDGESLTWVIAVYAGKNYELHFFRTDGSMR